MTTVVDTGQFMRLFFSMRYVMIRCIRPIPWRARV